MEEEMRVIIIIAYIQIGLAFIVGAIDLFIGITEPNVLGIVIGIFLITLSIICACLIHIYKSLEE